MSCSALPTPPLTAQEALKIAFSWSQYQTVAFNAEDARLIIEQLRRTLGTEALASFLIKHHMVLFLSPALVRKLLTALSRGVNIIELTVMPLSACCICRYICWCSVGARADCRVCLHRLIFHKCVCVTRPIMLCYQVRTNMDKLLEFVPSARTAGS